MADPYAAIGAPATNVASDPYATVGAPPGSIPVSRQPDGSLKADNGAVYSGAGVDQGGVKHGLIDGSARSLGSGLLSGLAGTADMLPATSAGQGGALATGTKIANWAMSGLGLESPQQGDANVAAMDQFRQNSGLLTSQEKLQNTGILHTPQNGYERASDLIGQFLPGALFGPDGDAGMMSQITQRAKNVAFPAAGNSAGSGIVQALGGNQDAQNIGGFLGGVVGGAGANARMSPAEVPALPGANLDYAPRFGDVTRATRYVASRMGAPSAAVQGAADAGVPTILAQRGGSTGINALRSLARQPGPTNDNLQAYAGSVKAADPTTRGVIGSFPERAQSHIASVTGITPQAANGDMGALIESRRAGDDGVRSAYDSALYADPGTNAVPKPINMTPQLSAVLEEPEVQKALATAKRKVGTAATVGGIAIDPATGAPQIDPHTLQPVIEQQPTAVTMDLAKKYLGKAVVRDPITKQPIDSGDAGIGNEFIQDHLRNLTTALAGDETTPAAIPGYRTALNKGGDVLGMQEAFNFGRDNFFTGRVDTPTWNKYVSGLSDADQAAHQAGVSNAINDMAEKGNLSPKSFSSPLIQSKMAATYGPDATSQILTRLGQEQENLSTLKQAMPRGQTTTSTDAHEIAAQNGMQPGIMPLIKDAAITAGLTHVPGVGHFVGPAYAIGKQVPQRVIHAMGAPFRMPQGARDLAGSMLSSPTLTPQNIYDFQSALKNGRPRMTFNTPSLLGSPAMAPGLLNNSAGRP